jgi:methionine-rich copper-binding protein CopC
VERDRAKTTVIHVPLFAKALGACRVNWRIVGTDGRSANGSFIFVVTPPKGKT